MLNLSIRTIIVILLATASLVLTTKISHAFPPALVPQTGQTLCYNTSGTEIPCTGTGQDGDIKAGVVWPNPRFTVNTQIDGITPDGTVTDNLTGLVWLKNADCFGGQIWTTALATVNALSSGMCGLSDGSTAGNWRLPNINELESLVDVQRSNPALPLGHPFVNVQYCIWSSSTSEGGGAFDVLMDYGTVYGNTSKSAIPCRAWPVRDEQ